MSKRKINKSQSGSAYWHYVANSGSYMHDGDMKEAHDANPDQLSEDDILIKKAELSEEDEDNLASYYKLVSAGILKKLAPRQREVWKLRFFRWCSEDEIATKLGISISAVRSHLARAAVKIKEEIERQSERRRLDGHYFNDGFKKGVHTIGETNTDKEFGDRLDKSKGEIDAFLSKHPELRKDL